MTDPAGDAQYQEFLAWQKNKAGSAVPTPSPERPTPTIADVLKAIVNTARLADEGTVRLYHEVIDAWHEATTPKASDV